MGPSPVRFSCNKSYSNPDSDGDAPPLCHSPLAEQRCRDRAMALGEQKRRMVLNRVGTGSHVCPFDGTLPRARASSHVGGRISDADWASGRSTRRTRMDVDKEEKRTKDDPAVEPRQGSQHRRLASDTEDWGSRPSGCPSRLGVWGKLGRVCRERVCKKLFLWGGRVAGAGRGGTLGDADGPESESEVEPRPGPPELSGDGGVRRSSAPRVGATGPGRAPVAAERTTDTRTMPELSRRRRLSKQMRPRPTSASAWVTGPTSTSTPMQNRSSGRLVKRRPRSGTMAGDSDWTR